MGWDGLSDSDEDYFDQDYFDYMNKTGIYEEHDYDELDDMEDDLLLSGLDPDELDYMDEDERREAIEDAGLDPDDYDDLFMGIGSSHRSSYSRNSSSYGRSMAGGSANTYRNANRPSTTNRITTQDRQSSANNRKWGILEFTCVIIVISIIGAFIDAIGGGFLVLIALLFVGSYLLSR